VVEAIAAGSRPVLPHRLSYPWLIPDEYHDDVLYPDGGLVNALMTALADPTSPPGLQSALLRYSWEQLAPIYDQRLEAIANRAGAV
jgi:hypothetical protein